jgi:serine/threonine protein kinase
MLLISKLRLIVTEYNKTINPYQSVEHSPLQVCNRLFGISDTDRELSERELIEFIGQITHILQFNESDSNYKQSSVLFNTLFEHDHLNQDDSLLQSLQLLNKAGQLSPARIFQIKNHSSPVAFAEACQIISSNRTFSTNENDYAALAQCTAPVSSAKAIASLYQHGYMPLNEHKIAIIKHEHPIELGEAITTILHTEGSLKGQQSKIVQHLVSHPTPKILADAFHSLSTHNVPLNAAQINKISQLAIPGSIVQSLIDSKGYMGLNNTKIRDAIIDHASPLEFVDALILLEKNRVTISEGSDQEDLFFNSKNSQALAESYVLLKNLGLDPLSKQQLIALPEYKSIDTIKALAKLQTLKITLFSVEFQKFINQSQADIKLIAEALIELKFQSPNLSLKYDNIKMIIDHERPKFALGVLKFHAAIKKPVTQDDLNKIKLDSYKDWRSDNIPTFEVERPSISEEPLKGVSATLRQEIEARAFKEYHESMKKMERSVCEVALSYVTDTHQIPPPFPKGKAHNDQAGPLLQFANLYSERYLDLYKAYVSIEKKQGIPMIPVTAGQMKLHGFTSEDILTMQPSCKVFSELVKIIKDTVNDLDVYNKIVILMVGENGQVFTRKEALQLSKIDLEARKGLSLSDEQHKAIIAVLKIYDDLDENETNLIKKAYFLMHHFGHMTYVKIADQLDAIGQIIPSTLRDAPEDERLLMEIRHRVSGDSTIHQNSPGTLGGNPLAYLNVLTKGEPENPEAEFRNKMFFVYMSNHFANAVVLNDETVGEINQWLKDKGKDWSLDLNFITTLRHRGAQYIPPIFRYGANAALNTEFRHTKSEEDVSEYYRTNRNISIREAMEGTADKDDLHRSKLSDREYFNQMGELSYQRGDPRSERQVNFGTGAAIYDLFPSTNSMSDPTQTYLNNVNELGIPVCAGISGTLDQSTAMAGLVGLGTSADKWQKEYELESIRLAYLAFMLPGSDHTAHEILQSSKTYGLSYVAGPGYEQFIYPRDSANVQMQLEILQKRRGSALPGYFFTSEYAARTLKELEQQILASKEDLDGFLARLGRAKTDSLQPGLAKKLAPEEHEKLLNFFINVSNENLKSQLALLEPGKSLRFDKGVTGLPRSVNILRTEHGEYKLIVETKSKLAMGVKDLDAPVVRGTIKTGKPCWRLDVQEEYFGLTMTVNVDDPKQKAYVEEIARESALSRELSKSSDNICMTEIGTEFEKGGKKKITVYSERAIGTLDKFLTADIDSKVREKLISDLLQGVKTIHDKGYAHQDLKPQNLLVYGDGSGGYTLKIADFGEAKKHGAKGEYGSGPHKYQSPELAYYYTNPHTRDVANCEFGEKNFHQRLNILGRLFADAPQNSEIYAKETLNREHYQSPNKSNDMWAVGMLVYSIQHGKAPESVADIQAVQDDPLLHGLLDANRPTRIDVDKAMQLNESLISAQARNFDKVAKGHRYYIGVSLKRSSEDRVADARGKLGDDISQYLDGLSIDGLKPIDRDRWHMTVGWLENKNSEHTPISDAHYQKILPQIAPIIAKYNQLALEVSGFSLNREGNGLHVDFNEKSGQLLVLREEIKALVEEVVPEVVFKTARPHAVIARSSTKIDRAKLTPFEGEKSYEIANMNMMYYDERSNGNVIAERFATNMAVSVEKTDIMRSPSQCFSGFFAPQQVESPSAKKPQQNLIYQE